MTTNAKRPLDDDFERALLTSARLDSPPAGATDEAFARFAAGTAGLAVGTLMASSVAAQMTPAARVLLAAKWLLVGVAGGGVAVAAFVSVDTAVDSAPAVDPAPSARSAVGVATRGLATSNAAPPEEVGAKAAGAPSLVPFGAMPSTRVAVAPSASPAAPPMAAAAIRPRADEPSAKVALGVPGAWAIVPAPAAIEAPAVTGGGPAPATTRLPEPSSLAAEVAALDGARGAIARSPEEALTRLARYRQAFPHGTLWPEAQVLTVEALAAQGQAKRAREAAAAFVERYPGAPQGGRMRELSEGAGGSE